MTINQDSFFKECSMPLHEHLDLETAIPHFVEALKKYIPADGMTIQLLEPSLKSSRSVIWYLPNMKGMKKMKNTIISMPEETRSQLKKSPLPDLRIINRPEDDPVGEYFIEVAGSDYSNMAMFIYRKKQRLGVVVLAAKGRDRYTEEDLALFSLLREPFALALNNYLQSLEILKLKSMLDKQIYQREQGVSVEDIIGHNFGLRNTINLVKMVAPLDNPVLITGETGVGKEMIAAAVHNLSSRHRGPLISVNCGAIPETVVDSELFGHEKGAFTGAVSKRMGRFERADNGTIFLDEIGELKPEIQVKLLRVLQNGEIERVGSSEQIHIDVRIIAATHRNLENMVQEGLFREDLLYRINVFPIVIPPLRTRKKDIPALVDHFVLKKSKELKIYPVPALSSKAIDRLMDYHWPGNVRELENVIERELILYTGGPLTFDGFIMTATSQKSTEMLSVDEQLLPFDDASKAYIQHALKITNGQIGGPKGAAEVLGLQPSTLRNKMIRLGIPFKKSKQ
ncbi:sigma 54-interacting transcriptional regulator [bacterium]|nr:sigma 54-interacting transcriptional regulator [bacterium]